MSKSIAVLALSCIALPLYTMAQYHVEKSFPVKGDGRWDYIAVCPDNNNLYVSHGTEVAVINKISGAPVAVIPNTTGVHGIAFTGNKGFISDGKLNTVTVIDIKTNKEIAQIKTGDNPDAIMYEPYSKKILVCNGHSQNMSVIDPVNNTVVHTIELGGKPETAVSDNEGHVYVNIEDKNEIVALDMKHFSVIAHWTLEKGEGPTGLAIDTKTKRLFSGCDGQLYVMNAENGKIVTHLPIGDGCDGVAFDPSLKYIFTSNGIGNVSIIHEAAADKYAVKETATTERGARTLAVDEKTHIVYIPSAQLETKMPEQHKEGKKVRPGIVPGSFHVLVLGR